MDNQVQLAAREGRVRSVPQALRAHKAQLDSRGLQDLMATPGVKGNRGRTAMQGKPGPLGSMGLAGPPVRSETPGPQVNLANRGQRAKLGLVELRAIKVRWAPMVDLELRGLTASQASRGHRAQPDPRVKLDHRGLPDLQGMSVSRGRPGPQDSRGLRGPLETPALQDNQGQTASPGLPVSQGLMGLQDSRESTEQMDK